MVVFWTAHVIFHVLIRKHTKMLKSEIDDVMVKLVFELLQTGPLTMSVFGSELKAHMPVPKSLKLRQWVESRADIFEFDAHSDTIIRSTITQDNKDSDTGITYHVSSTESTAVLTEDVRVCKLLTPTTTSEIHTTTTATTGDIKCPICHCATHGQNKTLNEQTLWLLQCCDPDCGAWLDNDGIQLQLPHPHRQLLVPPPLPLSSSFESSVEKTECSTTNDDHDDDDSIVILEEPMMMMASPTDDGEDDREANNSSSSSNVTDNTTVPTPIAISSSSVLNTSGNGHITITPDLYDYLVRYFCRCRTKHRFIRSLHEDMDGIRDFYAKYHILRSDLGQPARIQKFDAQYDGVKSLLIRLLRDGSQASIDEISMWTQMTDCPLYKDPTLLQHEMAVKMCSLIQKLKDNQATLSLFHNGDKLHTIHKWAIRSCCVSPLSWTKPKQKGFKGPHGTTLTWPDSVWDDSIRDLVSISFKLVRKAGTHECDTVRGWILNVLLFQKWSINKDGHCRNTDGDDDEVCLDNQPEPIPILSTQFLLDNCFDFVVSDILVLIPNTYHSTIDYIKAILTRWFVFNGDAEVKYLLGLGEDAFVVKKKILSAAEEAECMLRFFGVVVPNKSGGDVTPMKDAVVVAATAVVKKKEEAEKAPPPPPPKVEMLPCAIERAATLFRNSFKDPSFPVCIRGESDPTFYLDCIRGAGMNQFLLFLTENYSVATNIKTEGTPLYDIESRYRIHCEGCCKWKGQTQYVDVPKDRQKYELWEMTAANMYGVNSESIFGYWWPNALAESIQNWVNNTSVTQHFNSRWEASANALIKRFRRQLVDGGGNVTPASIVCLDQWLNEYRTTGTVLQVGTILPFLLRDSVVVI
jgi:hypothetical protein